MKHFKSTKHSNKHIRNPGTAGGLGHASSTAALATVEQDGLQHGDPLVGSVSSGASYVSKVEDRGQLAIPRFYLSNRRTEFGSNV